MSSASIPVPGWRRYTEQVEQIKGNGRYTILLQEHPLYLQGYAPLHHKRRFGNLTLAPKIPLYQLGWLGQITPSAGITAAGQAATQAATSKAPAGPTALNVASTSMMALAPAAGPAAPFVLAAAVVMKLIAGFWAAHDARVAGAKDENSVANSAVLAFNQSLKAVFAAANSSDPTQNIQASQAITACQQIMQSYWTAMIPHMTGPGRADASGAGANCGTVNPSAPCSGMISGHKCDKSCTAGCCVGCQDLTPSIYAAIAVLQAGGGSFQVCQVFGDKYGLSNSSSYTLTYTPPTVASSASSLLSDLTGGTSTGGSSSLLLLGLAAIAALLVMR